VLSWRVGRASAIAGGLLGILLGGFSGMLPGPWGAAGWGRALVVPLGLLLAAGLALQARAGPRPAGRAGWWVLVAGLAALTLATSAMLAWPLLGILAALGTPALYAALIGAVVVGIVAGGRRALPRGAAYALLLSPLFVVAARTLLPPSAAGAVGLGLAFLVVGAATTD